jgi:hypothetical protein
MSTREFQGKDQTMRLLACLLLSLSPLANAQVYVDESSNFGNFTRLATVSPFNFVDEFSIGGTYAGYQPSPPITITVYGQNGKGVCSGRGCGIPPTYQTTFSAPQLYIAQPNSPNWLDITPATDVNGALIAFTCISSNGSACVAWSWAGELPADGYSLNLHLTGTSCGGRYCQIAGDSYVFVHTNVQYIALPP